MRVRAGVLIALLGMLLAGGCADLSLSTPEPVTIVIAGATAMRPVLRDLTDAFSRQYPEVLFDLRGGGSTLGEEQARDGSVTLGASTLLPPMDEESGEPVDDGLRRVPIGLDGLALIVHESNPITNLTLLQTRDIFAGKVLNWVQLGGKESEIQLVSREEGSGSRDTFETRVMGDESVSLTAVVMPTPTDVIEYVAEHPTAVAYVSAAVVRSLMDEDPANDGTAGVRVVALEGALPTLATIREQSYFLIQPIYLLSATEPAGRVRQFLDFAVSPAGQEIVARYHAPVR
jgi:phosphate transport system substrate-binding protein